MKISQKGIDLVKEFEGCVLKAYQDPAKVWTIGYGSTGPDIKEGVVWVQSQANMALVARLNAISSILSGGFIQPALTQNQFDALCSLCYNIGQSAFRGSTLIKKLNERDFSGAADEFLRWDKVKGVANKGLARRRAAERAFFLS